jgi:hypothetical protein
LFIRLQQIADLLSQAACFVSRLPNYKKQSNKWPADKVDSSSGAKAFNFQGAERHG